MYSGWNPARYFTSLKRAVSGSSSAALSSSAATLSVAENAPRVGAGTAAELRKVDAVVRYTERLSGVVSTDAVCPADALPGAVGVRTLAESRPADAITVLAVVS